MYCQIARYEMTQSLCKRDYTKSKSHPSVKLAPVLVFSCKHPLYSLSVKLFEITALLIARLV